MEKRQNFYVYDRREMVVLVFLGLLVGVFCFTLGMHLGRRIGTLAAEQGLTAHSAVKIAQDELPGRTELSEAGKVADAIADEELNKTVHHEVTKSGVHLDTPRSIALPQHARARHGGATTLPESRAAAGLPALARAVPQGLFTLQIGSYGSVHEAAQKVHALEGQGLTPFVRSVFIEKKGQWYRVYLGGYQNAREAEEQGQSFTRRGVVKAFIVAKMPDA